MGCTKLACHKQWCTLCSGPPRGITPKNLHPIFAKFSGVEANFLFALYADPQDPLGKNFGNCTLAHFPEIEFRNFAENRFFSSYGKFLLRKKVERCVRFTPLG